MVKLESGRLCGKYKEDGLPSTVLITASGLTQRLHLSLHSSLIGIISQFFFQSESEWLIFGFGVSCAWWGGAVTRVRSSRQEATS